MRYARIGGIVTLVVLLIGPPAVYAFLLFGPRIAFENGYHRIEDGMSVEEVRQTLGAETRESTQDERWTGGGMGVRRAVHGDRVLVWEKDGQFIWVGFVGDRVVSKHFFEYDL
jgi:hypothetical protein